MTANHFANHHPLLCLRIHWTVKWPFCQIIVHFFDRQLNWPLMFREIAMDNHRNGFLIVVYCSLGCFRRMPIIVYSILCDSLHSFFTIYSAYTDSVGWWYIKNENSVSIFCIFVFYTDHQYCLEYNATLYTHLLFVNCVLNANLQVKSK